MPPAMSIVSHCVQYANGLHAANGARALLTPLLLMLTPRSQAYKHYTKYATQALKAANLPKNIKNMKGDMPMNPRHMQESIKKMGQVRLYVFV